LEREPTEADPPWLTVSCKSQISIRTRVVRCYSVRMDSGERKVMVWGKPHVVLVSRISNAAWQAVGDYMGEPIRVEDRSEGSAFMRWRDAAISKGNP